MARPKNNIPSLRFHKTSGRWYIFTGGKRHYLGTVKSEAEAKYRRIIAAGGTSAEVPPEPTPVVSADGMLVAEALARFRDYAKTKYPDQRDLARFDRVIAATVAVCSTLPVAQFDDVALESVRDRLLSETPPLARGYINALVRALKTIFAWMKKRKLITATALDEIRSLVALRSGEGGREVEPVPPVEDWVIQATLHELPPTLRAMVEFQRAAGLRPGEMCIMRRRDLSLSPVESILIPGTRRTAAAIPVGGSLVWIYCPATHKTLKRNKMRVVAIGPTAQQVLGPFVRDCQPDDYVFRPCADLSDARAKALGAGPYFTVRAYRNAILRAVARANRARKEAYKRGLVSDLVLVPHWHPMQIRHTLGEDAANKLKADDAAVLLGHSASVRALNEYVQASILKAAEAAAKVG